MSLITLKTITLGDDHGDGNWKSINVNYYDLIRHCGDYFDDFNNNRKKEYENFQDLLLWKKQYPEKISLGIGNHDLPRFLWHTSMYDTVRWCSGFSTTNLFKIHNLYTADINAFTPSLQLGKHLWTHAGISNTSFNNFFAENWNKECDLADFLKILWRRLDKSLFYVGKLRGGMGSVGSIFWADKRETEKDYLIGYHQIVGHHPVSHIQSYENESSSITYVDTRLGNKEFYEKDIEIDEEEWEVKKKLL